MRKAWAEKGKNRILALLLLTTLVFFTVGSASIESRAAKEVPLTLSMAKTLGLVASSDYAKLENERSLKETSLAQAVRSISEKKRNMSTFRWTPLLSFKFPEKPNLSEEYEFSFKPVQIQSEIDTLEHKLTDQVLGVYEEISLLYMEIVTEQMKLAFQEERLELQEEALAKNRVRLKTGDATQSDVETLEKNVETLTDSVATSRSNLIAVKKKLSDALGMDVTTGYSFENPFLDAQIPRSVLPELIRHTLDRDVSHYEAGMNATTAKLSLETNYSLMKNQYGGKMNVITEYVTASLQGEKVDGKAFKKSYDKFLKVIDQPWQGKIRILFIKIPKEWFKGEISGIRYVEDEPYALYEAALEYRDALMEKENIKKDLTQQVEDGYNSLVSMRKAYLTLLKNLEESEERLKKEEIWNKLGQLTFEEYQDSLEAHEELQNEMLESLSQYSQSLYTFDRLTCGAVSAYLEGTEALLNGLTVGESYVEGAYYHIEPIIQEQEFRLRVILPDDFEVDITHYELWCGQEQIGGRTEIDRSLRHLSLAMEEVPQVKLRFYKDGEFVDDCVIDPDMGSGPLKILSEYIIGSREDVVGSFAVQTNAVTGMVTITMVAEDEQIRSYRIRNARGKWLASSSTIPIEEKFLYLSLMQEAMEELVIEFYGEGDSLLYTGYFDTRNKLLKKSPEDQ